MYIPSDDEVSALINANPGGMTLYAIAAVMQVSPEYVRALQQQALGKFARALCRKGLDPSDLLPRERTSVWDQMRES